MLLLLSACTPPTFWTDEGQIGISDEQVVDLETDGVVNAFLAGTTLCPAFDCEGDECPEDFLDCFAQSFTGPVEAGECLAFTGPGVVDWTFTAQECPANDEGYAPVDDHVAIEVLAAEEVEGRLAMLLEEELDATEGETWRRVDGGEDWRLEEGAPRRLVAGEPFVVFPRLVSIATGEPVAWRDGNVTATEVSVEPEASPGMARVVAGEGQSGSLSLEAGGAAFAVGTVEGVPASEVDSIEIAVVYSVDGEAGTSSPVGARAILRDADGGLLFGAPVKWKVPNMVFVQGPAASEMLPGGDYVSLADACEDPGKQVGEQRAMLTASFGGKSAKKELVWTPRTEAAPVEGWTRNELCTDACGCASGGSGAIGVIATVLAMGVGRRRRA